MTVNTLGSDERTAKPRNAAWLWPVLSWSSIWFVTGRLEKPGARLLRLLALTLALAIWVNLQPEGSEASPAAGALGNWIGGRMVSTLGRFLSVLVVAPLA